MASHKEMSRLVTDMNITSGSGRPSRNSQGICNTLQQPAMPTTPLPETPVNPATIPSAPVNSLLARGILPDNNSHAATNTPNSNSPVAICTQDKQVEALTPCIRQHDRFVDPSGKPLQPVTVIICKDLPFVVSSNGKICNFMGDNMKQLYVADPSKHKFLVKATNSQRAFSNMIGSVLSLLLGFHRRQNHNYNSKDVEDQNQATQATSEASTIETVNTIHSGKSLEIRNHVDTASEDNVSDLADFYANKNVHHDICDPGFFPTENIFTNHVCNEMLSHYNHILIGCFKDIFQSVDTNNLARVLQALKELNFMLANRAPELTTHYSIQLGLQQVSAKEVTNFIDAYCNRPTANNTEYSNRGRPRIRGNQNHRHSRYTRQSSPVPRYNQQSCRSDIHSHSNTDRLYNQTSYNNRNRHHSHSSLNHSHNIPNNPYHNTSNMQHNIDMHSSNISDIIRLIAKSDFRFTDASAATVYTQLYKDI